jgi:tetratricopeptide (TPR) repeat protein
VYYFLIFSILFSFSSIAEESSSQRELTQDLRESLILGPVDIKDVLKLGGIYENSGELKNAIKVYLFGIKKLHSSSWKDIKKLDELNEIMIDLKEPSQESLLLAFKVGILYYDLYLTDSSSEEFSTRILDTASKYFLICEFFKFNEPKTKYFLGMIYKEYGNYKKASLSFLKSWELYSKSKKIDKDLEQKFELLLGESLLNYGYLDIGLAFLRSAYYYKNGNRYLQSYAKEYLNEFKGSSVGGSVSFLVGNDSNVLIGNSVGTETIKTSNFTSKGASLFLSHAPSYSSVYNFSVGLAEELYTESSLKDNDSRNLSFTTSWDYRKFDKMVISTRYVFSKNYSRPRTDEEFEADYDFHELSPIFKFFKKRNHFTLSLPFSRSRYRTGAQLDKVGIIGSYSYLSFSKYWNPAARLELSSEEEDVGFEKSKLLTIGLSNNLEIFESISISLDLSIEKKTNSDSGLGYSERVFEISGFYSFEKLEGLSIEGSLSSESNSSEEVTSDSRIKTSFGLSYFL